jgi:hypothetical protein
MRFRTLKIPKKDIIITIIIVLVGTASFALGRISNLFDSSEPIKIEYGDTLHALATSTQAAAAVTSKPSPVEPVNSPEMVVAAKTGTRYYFPWCSGVSRIKEENKITFKSSEEARKAGYTPATNCKGLK